MFSSVAIVRCKDYETAQVQQSVDSALELLGGIEKFVRPQSRILIKPNLLMAKPPESAIDTHPEVVRAVINTLKRIGCMVFVGDGPSVWGNQIENVDEVYRVAGIEKVCAEEGVSLIKLQKRRMRKYFPLSAFLDECDFVVNLPKFKTHGFTLMSAAVKNLFGLVSGTFKTELHKSHFQPEDFSRMLVDVLEEVRPALTIVDGITALEGDGPSSSGRPKDVGLVLAGADCVALDSVLAKIMGIQPFDVLTTKEAAKRGVGVGDLSKVQLLGERLDDLPVRPFILPATSSLTSRIPGPLVSLLKRHVRYWPRVDRAKCIRCSACIDACPSEVISMTEKGICFEYSRCIACFCCQEACPAPAIKIKKSVLAKLIGL